MLACLHAAFSHDAQVESYLDTAEGVVSALPEGRCWVSEVILKPRMTFDAHQGSHGGGDHSLLYNAIVFSVLSR
jgi:hypothetical protein